MKGNATSRERARLAALAVRKAPEEDILQVIEAMPPLEVVALRDTSNLRAGLLWWAAQGAGHRLSCPKGMTALLAARADPDEGDHFFGRTPLFEAGSSGVLATTIMANLERNTSVTWGQVFSYDTCRSSSMTHGQTKTSHDIFRLRPNAWRRV